ncbi:MAG: phosphotransferase [Anaerolineae bacterium]|jgi:aminoglycoside phosphotransferase (APT) family kinase protein|nr:phosphotransferase [Anaerolineae bacterium]
MLPELDIEQPALLLDYLRRRGDITATALPHIETLAGGVSSRTVRVTLPDGTAWVLKQSLAKLRVAVDWFSDPARIHLEAKALRWLNRLLPAGAVPAFIFEDEAAHVLAMQAVPAPHATWKTLLLTGGPPDQDQAAQFGHLLGTLHRAAAAHRETLLAEFGAGFFESLRIEPYYQYTAAQVPAAAPFLEALIADTRAHRLTLVHGDYSPKNMLVYAGRLVLLDYEVAHVGDPAFDVGFSMTHLLSKAHHRAHLRPQFAAAARRHHAAYQAALGEVPWAAAVEARAVRHTLGCLLARVDGRSPLEYLTAPEKARQRAAVLALLPQPPATMPALIEAFTAQLAAAGG